MSKSQFIYVLKFAISIIVISFIADKLVFFALNKISDQVMVGQTVGKVNQFLSLKDSLDVVVLGHSRANRHIDVSRFEGKAFNMGVDGTRIAYYATLIKTLPEQKKQTVIISIDPNDLFDPEYTGSDIRALKMKFKRHPKITEALIKSDQITSLHKFFYCLNYNNRVIGILKNYVKPKYNYLNYNGFDPILLNEDQKKIRDQILKEPNSKACDQDYQPNSIALNYLNEIQHYFNNSNKRVLFVSAPIYDDNCEIDNNKLNQIMVDLELNYLDFTNYFKDNNNDKSLWKDKTHLSAKGATQFSDALIQQFNLYFELEKN